jgi:hypothetical protein
MARTRGLPIGGKANQVATPSIDESPKRRRKAKGVKRRSSTHAARRLG